MQELIDAVDAVLAADPPTSCPAALTAQVLQLRRQLRRVEAAYLRWLAALDRSGAAVEEGYACTAAWLRVRGHADGPEAGSEIRLARALADVLPSVAAGMADGSVGTRQAQVIASLRKDIGDECLRAVEPSLAAAARDCPSSVLRNFSATVRLQYAPETAAARESKQYDERELSVGTSLWGMGVGSWWLPPAMQETVLAAIDALSKPLPGDTRSAGQRRADGLMSLAERALRDGDLPDTGAGRPAVTVTVSAGTLVGDMSSLPARTGRGQVVGDDWLQRLTCDASVARVVFGPAGQVLDSGRTTRVFTPAQRRGVVARDSHCVWPGCTAPAPWCDAHHIVHWSRGGATSVDNAALLCGRHHDRVHLRGHAIRTDERTGRKVVDLRERSDPRWRPPPRPHRRT